MINLQDFIDKSGMFKKFKVNELLFAEFKCPLGEEATSLWWHNNFFAFVLSGETYIKTPGREYLLKPGSCVFARKGSVITHSDTHEDFCELIVFVPDDFIRTVVRKYRIPMPQPDPNALFRNIIPLSHDDVLTTYFHSLLAYFHQDDPPSEHLLNLKFEELVINILSKKSHQTLKNCFGEICASSKPSIREIMEANFSQNLSMEEFARLCARSLSAFKTEFKSIFNKTPGKWLLEKRLEYGLYLLENTRDTVAEISYNSGFMNRTHFTRVFKQKYWHTPAEHRLQKKAGAK